MSGRRKPGEKGPFRDNYLVSPRARGQAGQIPKRGEPPAQGSDERELIASVLRKDRKAAARLVAGHIDAVYAYTRHRLAPHTEPVDDVVQDVFLSALHGLATFQGQSSLRTWLIGIARHKVDDIYRQRLRLPEAIDDPDLIEEASPLATLPLEEQIDATRSREKVRTVLAQMPERYGLMLLWRYWEQRSTRDMAAAIGTTEKSVERTLARARARFKELWLKE